MLSCILLSKMIGKKSNLSFCRPGLPLKDLHDTVVK